MRRICGDLKEEDKGTNKIVGWCIGHGLEELDFKEIGGGFLVRFHAPEELLSLIPDKTNVDLQEVGLNERQINRPL